MNAENPRPTFAGSVPLLYEKHLVPMIFEPYAIDLAKRVAALQPSRVLEIAAGTGVVTRQLARALPASTTIVASDLSQPMLDVATSIGTPRAVEWRQADAMKLPFADSSFDVVVCQFGAMFFPDKAIAFAEMRRVLRPGGTFLFNAWDRIENNEFAATVMQCLAKLFPSDPPRFMAQIPHGYFDSDLIAADLADGGFDTPVEVNTVEFRSRAPSPEVAATAYCQGTPMRNEIESRGGVSLEQATAAATEALAARFGSGVIEGRIRAHVMTVQHR